MDAYVLVIIFQLGVRDQRALTFSYKSLEACQKVAKRFEREGHPRVPGYVVGTYCREPWQTDLHFKRSPMG